MSRRGTVEQSPSGFSLGVLRLDAQPRQQAGEERREGDVRLRELRSGGRGRGGLVLRRRVEQIARTAEESAAGGRGLAGTRCRRARGDAAGAPDGGADFCLPAGVLGLAEVPGVEPRVCAGGFGSSPWSGATSSSMAWKTDSTSPPTSVSCAGSFSRSRPHASRWERENDESVWIGPSEPSRSYAAWRSRWPSAASCFIPASARRISPRDSWSNTPVRPRSISLRASDSRFEAWSRYSSPRSESSSAIPSFRSSMPRLTG